MKCHVSMCSQYTSRWVNLLISVYPRIHLHPLTRSRSQSKHTLVKKIWKFGRKNIHLHDERLPHDFPHTIQEIFPQNYLCTWSLYMMNFFSISVHASPRSLLCSNVHIICNIHRCSCSLLVYLYAIILRNWPYGSVAKKHNNISLSSLTLEYKVWTMTIILIFDNLQRVNL